MTKDIEIIPVFKAKQKPGPKQKFKEASSTVALRVPASKHDYYSDLFNSIVMEDEKKRIDNQQVM